MVADWIFVPIKISSKSNENSSKHKNHQNCFSQTIFTTGCDGSVLILSQVLHESGEKWFE